MENKRSRMNDSLLGKMWKTKSARFNAHLRLARKQNLSTWAISILAFYIFAASLFPLAYPHLSTGEAARPIAILTVIISVFLIIITLLEGSKKYDQEAERMLQCALDISEVYNQFQALSSDKANQRRVEFTNEYSAVLDKHALNHKDIDFLQFQLRNREELGTDGMLRYVVDCVKYAGYISVEYGLYILLVVIPPLSAFLFRSQMGF